ncbi:hypothetical protein CSOJ01_07874 [Colletotrichum sojae]|uniref:Uncharacterized protein n=1 Tax=Colletotrichum sojae TaxID=2175907 RepID=A0A8H6J7E7_9PEZI|nr:hypothetical protein CSOJ01_07874 [Colletotrichum sojae]
MNFTVPLKLIYADWTAPPLSELNFTTNCTVTAEFARTWLADEKGASYAATSAYFRQALPPSLRGLPSTGQLIDWFMVLLRTHQAYDRENVYNESNASPMIKKVTVGAFRACTTEVCQALEWDGFPDLLGPGVMISAYIQAVLATVLGLVPLWEWILRRRGITPGRRQQHVIDSFNATIGIFADACLLLSFSSSLAGIILISRRDFDGGGTLVTLIWAIGLFYVNAICFPALLDEGVHKEVKRKKEKYVFLVIQLRPLYRRGEHGGSSTVFERQFLELGAVLYPSNHVGLAELLLGRSGFNSGDSKWTLGQFFAVGAWLPVLMELAFMLREGVEKGLDGRVPDGWTVVRAHRPTVALVGGDDNELQLLEESRKQNV